MRATAVKTRGKSRPPLRHRCNRIVGAIEWRAIEGTMRAKMVDAPEALIPDRIPKLDHHPEVPGEAGPRRRVQETPRMELPDLDCRPECPAEFSFEASRTRSTSG
ncbi:hypothetical protein K32_02740 [Kaistia sp. 32K]|nr:hypothetical protein K32_02740 [Kaistia sp. 32K]